MKCFTSFLVLFSFVTYAAAAGGTFTTDCAPLTIQRSDPIVTPGIASSHVHAVIGGNAFRRTMEGTFAKTATQTTCNKALDHSNYWVPALYHQNSNTKMWDLVQFTSASVYYQKRACDYSPTAKNCADSFVPLAPPDGFRMVAGDPMRRTQNDSDFAQRAIEMMCVGGGTSKQGHGFPDSRCDDYLRAEVYFPSCWDNVNLDTPDHKSHVAYPAIGDFNGGVCPKSHPVAIFSIFYEFRFHTQPFPDNLNKNFAFANGDPTGYGYHGDFIMGWTNRTALQHAHETCINAADCPTLGNQGIKSQPLIYPAIYEEEIGLNGTIAKLPGNNPVVFKNK